MLLIRTTELSDSRRTGTPVPDVNDDGITDVAVGAPGEGRVYVIRSPFSPPVVDVEPAVLDFGSVYKDFGPFVLQEIVVKNQGRSPLRFRSQGALIQGSDSEDFDVWPVPDLSQIETGATRSIAIGFDPLGLGPRSAELSILTDDPNNYTYSVPLIGTGVQTDYLPPIRILEPPNLERNGGFGNSVAGISDVNGDGFSDLVVGAKDQDASPQVPGSGKVYVVDGREGSVLHRLESNAPVRFGHFGYAVSEVNDLNGDGFSDLLVGAVGEEGGFPNSPGRVHVFDGMSGSWLGALSSPNADDGRQFGSSVSGLPDVTGDGLGDIIVGAPEEQIGIEGETTGRVYVFNGANGQIHKTLTLPNGGPVVMFGVSVSGMPDVTGDGFGEVIVGANHRDPDVKKLGRAFVFDGANGETLYELASPLQSLDAKFGASVSPVPDIDGDELTDIAVGAPLEDAGDFQLVGAVHLYSGGDGTFLRTIISPDLQFVERFGHSVSGCHDLDGDGRGDIVVGAYRWDSDLGIEDMGRVFLFNGSTGELIMEIGSPYNEEFGAFGVSVSGLSDANGDGFGDVVIGCPLCAARRNPMGSGLAVVYYSPFFGSCPEPDFNRDKTVDAEDLTQYVSSIRYSSSSHPPDLTCDRIIDSNDMHVFQKAWHAPTFPSNNYRSHLSKKQLGSRDP